MISSLRGEAKFKARLTDGIGVRVISADFGWREPNINTLTEDAGELDASMGATPLKGLQCEVRKF